MTKMEWIQWILYFFLYAFAGWVWESFYVSVWSHHWVNRGFLHGPFLPIYGFGALMILALTHSVHNHGAAVFLVGMIGTTILEYVTGVVLEQWFHKKLWDYSLCAFNFQGHISLLSSIFWGLLAVVLVLWVHPFFSSMIARWPAWVSLPLCLLLVALEGIDLVFLR